MIPPNEIRRAVMSNAWARFRYARSVGRVTTFGDALRDAWAWVKGEAARAQAAAAWAATPNKTVMVLRNATVSPIARTLAGRRFANRAMFKAAYTTAMVGG